MRLISTATSTLKFNESNGQEVALAVKADTDQQQVTVP
jgi:hypothetical protein